MRILISALAAFLVCGPVSAAHPLQDCLGVVRSFGDQSSWFSSCVVVGDGSYAITSWDAVTEKVGPETTQTVRYPIFISAFTGQAWPCEVVASNKDLNVAILKLPVKGLPAAALAQISEFSKAALGTMGELMSGEPVGNAWPTEIVGVAREKTGGGYRLTPGSWDAAKVFVTDIGKYKWAFLIDVAPDKPVPSGSVVSRGNSLVGIYLNRLVITQGSQKQVFGRCAMSTEIARFAGDKGIPTATLYSPPPASTKRDPNADAAFQHQARLYTAAKSGRVEIALESANVLVKLFPEDPQAKLMQGTALTGSGKFEEALKVFDAVAKVDPKYPTLRINRALALAGQKKTAEAEAELLKAAEETPSDVRVHIALADFYFADEKTMDKALTHAKKTVALSPSSPAARLLVAKIEKRRKNFQVSVNEIGEAIKMAPEWGEAWFALGSTFEEAGDKTNAEKAYRKLVEKQPQNPASLMSLASFLADQGKKDEPLEIIGKIRALTPAPPKDVLDAVKALEDKIKGEKPAAGGSEDAVE